MPSRTRLGRLYVNEISCRKWSEQATGALPFTEKVINCSANVPEVGHLLQFERVRVHPRLMRIYSQLNHATADWQETKRDE
jgi:hypothetical protein